MKRFGAFLMLACGWGSVSSFGMAAESEHPAFEVFMGASLISSDSSGNRLGLAGFHFSLAFDAGKRFRVIGDFAGHYRGTNIQSSLSGQDVRLSTYQFMGGPEFVFRGVGRTEPFVHALFGMASRHYYTSSGDPEFPRDVLAVDHGFASSFGGGIDVVLSRRWAMRVLQVDYVPTRLSHDLPQLSPIGDELPSLGTWQHNVRLSFGAVVRLGNGSP